MIFHVKRRWFPRKLRRYSCFVVVAVVAVAEAAAAAAWWRRRRSGVAEVVAAVVEVSKCFPCQAFHVKSNYLPWKLRRFDYSVSVVAALNVNGRSVWAIVWKLRRRLWLISGGGAMLAGANWWRRCIFGKKHMISTRRVLGHSLLFLNVCSHRSLTRSLRTARFALALSCAPLRSFVRFGCMLAHSFTPELMAKRLMSMNWMRRFHSFNPLCGGFSGDGVMVAVV